MTFGKLPSKALALAGALASIALVQTTSAYAAQPYSCVCRGKVERFLASTRYCEHQHNARSCTREQFRQTYAKACRDMGCRITPLR